MSRIFRPLLVLLALALLPAISAVAETASLRVVFTNNGEALDDPAQGRFYVYEKKKRERYVAWGNATRPARVEAGTYDIVIRYVNDTITEERVLESFALQGNVEQSVKFAITPAHLTLEITAAGAPIEVHAGSYDIHLAGRRGTPLASRRPGERVSLRSGVYDIEVFYRDPTGLQSTWLSGYRINGDQVETVEIGVASAHLRVALTQHGLPVSRRDGEWEVHLPGNPQPLGGGISGEATELVAGTYDIHATIRAAAGDAVERWLRGVEVSGDHLETIEFVEQGGGELRVQIRQDGAPLEDAWYSVYPAGDAAVPVATLRAGETATLPLGRYDIHCSYRKGSIRAEQWLRDQVVDGLTEFNVDLEIKIASLTIQPPRRVRDALEKSNVLFVVDSSLEMRGEMGGGSRMELTRQTLADTISLLDTEGLEVGLRVWGIAPRAQNNCSDSTLLLPLAALNERSFGQTLGLIRPSGFSPLAYSLQEAAGDLPPDERSTVIVLTAGPDSCSGDPCDAAARLLKRGRADQIHIIALDLPPYRDADLGCIGTYHSVANRAQLRRSLRAIFRDSAGADRGKVNVFLPGLNRWIASADLGQPLQIQEGVYDLLIRVGGQVYHWNDFELRGEMKRTAGERP